MSISPGIFCSFFHKKHHVIESMSLGTHYMKCTKCSATWIEVFDL